MAKSRGFSIYLLKDTFLPENALKDDHNIQLLLEEGTNLPINTVMYIADTPGNALW
ncbi:hypothetical protein IWX83_003348 [Flavobacterium sp. CG_9.1]|uniref:hypothetical protein n=1 Tax=Flavobacterium sp. CG_9.1 TaxID=2787728 RepID=UPI0018CAA95E|nr:hypothetical protein [Flavobacterium sp. CG_9.1]MBG6063538.1 hypothetical protein [Flavobacterium sp. CG_9.1]